MSCVNEFDPQVSEFENKDYIINSILFKDSIPEVFISKSSLYDSFNQKTWIDNAEVRISSKPIGAGEGMSQNQLLIYKDSSYIGGTALEAGMEYFLEVITKEGDKISAKTMIHQPQQIIASKFVYPAGRIVTPTYTGEFTRFNLEFSANTENKYFETFIYAKDIFHPLDKTKPYQILQTLNRNEIILKEALPDNFLYSFVFLLPNKTEDNIFLQFDYICCANPFFNPFYMVLQSCSEEYYLYKKSLYAHLDALRFQENFSTDDLYFPNFFKSITPVYSNINGGRGIFAGVSMDIEETTCNLVGYSCE